MHSRCNNPSDPGYPNYGGRGIRFQFDSHLECERWIHENLGALQDKQIDRIDNDGHYAPGNLRFATREENRANRARSRLSVADIAWAETDSPFSRWTTRHYLQAGLPYAAVIGLAYKAVAEKRKNWRGIRDRLRELGYTTL